MSTIQEEFEKTFERSHTDLYKELEVFNLESRFLEQSIKQGHNNISEVYERNLLGKDAGNKSMTLKKFQNEDEIKGDVHFHQATRFLLFYGQFLGLNSVLGILEDDTSKLRFTFSSIKFLFSLLMFMLQFGAFTVCWHWMIQNSMAVSKLTEILFYGLTSVSTGLFIKVSMKWPSLVKAVAASNLEEYMDAHIKRRCNITIVVLMSLTIGQHILALISRIANVTDCFLTASKDVIQVYSEIGYPWLFDLGFPYNLSIGILLQIFNTTSTLSWNYYGIFIICLSFYVTSILEQIHKKIYSAKRTEMSLEFWRSMRKDYTRVSHLVRSFDEVISSVVFTSFAGDLFAICIQLFNILSDVVSAKSKADQHLCPNYPSGPFNGYENAIYFYYTLVFVLGRSLMASVVTAKVHSTFMMIAPELYELPSSVYCDEIQRFIYQVHNDNLAFSGLQFFYVTKKMILSVVSTIVTYELVLLQFSGNDGTITNTSAQL